MQRTQGTTETLSPLVILAAGGTGGHIFPAEALARALLTRNIRVALITDRRGGQFSSDLDVPVYRIYANALGGNIIAKIRSVLQMGFGYLQARRLLHRLHPALVVGFGGYPCVPTVYAAGRAHIPVVLHEQNAVLGRANRVLLRHARLIATGFPQVEGLHGSNPPQLAHTGNPVRPAFTTLRDQPYPAITTEGALQLFVMGGSQGARVFSDVVPKALALLPEPLRRRIVIAQQCRAEDMERAKAGYAAAGIEPELASFFRDVPERLARCHLAICRSGASTIAELTALGRPAILVPYPFGHAGEQAANAEAVAEAGGAWVIPQDAFTPEALAVRLEALLTMPATLHKTAEAARNWGTIHAANNLAECVLKLIKADNHA
jgi:UDP-N-acetylglucosamine--N-acetylmuramyl-(pentapeptide) pyrophosphoryl-undecaprenol N-acetylglucosamine transferase